MDTHLRWRWLALLVGGHLVICILHGIAHDGGRVAMSLAGNLFVYAVVLAGPIVGLALAWGQPGPGGWLIAATMLGSLLFGIANHFVLDSPDHVLHVARDWRPVFGATALLLAVSEALGACVALFVARGRQS